MYQISPSDPPLGAFVLTVLFPLTFVPAVVETKACTSAPAAGVPPISRSKLVLEVAAAATSLKLFAVCNTPVTAVPENLYLIGYLIYQKKN